MTNPDKLKDTWLKLFFSKPHHEMSESHTRIFVGLTMNENPVPPKELEVEFIYQVIKVRAQAMFKQTSWQAMAFLTILTLNPGKAIMYLTAIKSKQADLTMATLAYTFPYGFLSNEDLDALWDAQKMEGGGNLVDII